MDSSLQLFTGTSFFRPVFRQVNVPSVSGLSSLTDAQAIESSGSFSYASVEATKNRFIIWRSSSNNLFLEEHCFGIDLSDNAICIQFQNSVVLPCTRIFETQDHTIILIATTSSVHRCVLPHPRSFKSKRDGVSVLSELSASTLTDPVHQCAVNLSGNVGLIPAASDCVLSNSEEALFALARTDGSILLFTLPNLEGENVATQDTLRSVSTIKRIWTGLVTPFVGQETVVTEKVFSLLFCIESDDVLLCAVYNDYKLRCWSCKRKDVDAIFDFAACFSDYQTSSMDSQIFFSDKWNLRKLNDGDSCYISVFTYVKQCGYFVFLSMSKQSERRLLDKILVIEGFSELESIDYTFTRDHLFALHRLNDKFSLKYLSIDLDNYEYSRWVSKKIDFSDYISTFRMENVDEFVDFVFHPCLFSQETIIKSLKICCKDFQVIELSSTDFYRLKARFKKYLQQISAGTQLRKRTIHDKSLQPVTFESVAENLRSCLWQYHKAFSNILGLFSLPFANLFGIITQDRFSLLVPIDSDILCTLHGCIDQSLCNFGSGAETYFAKCLSILQEWFEMDEKRLAKEFYVYVLKDKLVPNDAIKDRFVVPFLAEATTSRAEQFRKYIFSCERHFYSVFDQLLKNLQPDSSLFSYNKTATADSNPFIPSRIWMENLISGIIRRSCTIRFQLCRNLMLFLHLCIKFQSKLTLPQEICTKFELEILPALSDFCRFYCVLCWLLNFPEEKVEETEFNVENISNLKIIQGSSSKKVARQKGMKLLFDNFFGTSIRTSLLSVDFGLGPDKTDFVSLLHKIANFSLWILWPTGNTFDVYDFLADSNENIVLFELCEALYPWCEEGKYVRFYVKGEALLRLDKANEALTEFRKAYIGIKESDQLLLKRLGFEIYTEDDYSIQYFLKVAELFEQRGFNEPVIELCSDGLRETTPKENKLIHLLWTLLFKHFLATQKFDEAFMAMQYNTDLNSKRTCLRLFIIRLLEAKNFEKLISYQYGKFELDFVEMLEFRARTVDILQENYYNVLGAYFIKRSNYRRAAFYFYELSQRYRFESVNPETLRSRIQALSICIQNLSLARKEYRWIVCPGNQMPNPACSPKRSADDETIARTTNMPANSTQIMEINEIRKDLVLAQANLTIANKTKLFSYLSPNECLTQLCHLKAFDTAASLAVLFDLPIETVFEALTNACINIACSQPSDNTKLDLIWLETNRTFTNTFSAEMKASEICWSILSGYLHHFSRFYAPSVLYRCVCRKLLAYSQQLPAWFSAAFKKIDFPEFLRILIEYNKLDEASTFICDYINAVLGVGMDDFGLEESLSSNSRPVILPYSSIDLVLELLAEDAYKNLHALEKKTELETTLKEYFRHLSSVETAATRS